jgi:chemotaxis family two-component system response regulator Rcp1
MIDNALMHTRPAEILLVEDNDNDAELTRIAFRRAKLAVNLQHVTNGEECMALLRHEGRYASARTPDLILLDLNMPRMDGREVLAELEKDERLRHLPVVVLTSSKGEADVLASYKLKCSSYLVKPISFDGFAQMIQALHDYWFTLVVLPGQAQAEA